MSPTGLKEAVEVTDVTATKLSETLITAQKLRHRDKALTQKEVWMDKLRAVIKRRGSVIFPGYSCSYFNFIGKQKKNRTKKYPWLFYSPSTFCVYPATWNLSDIPENLKMIEMDCSWDFENLY